MNPKGNQVELQTFMKYGKSDIIGFKSDIIGFNDFETDSESETENESSSEEEL